MNDEQLSELAHHTLRVERSIAAHHDRLLTQPVTRSEFLLGTANAHDFDVQGLKEVAAALDAAIKQHGADAVVIAENDQHNLGGLRGLIAGAQAAVAPYLKARAS